MYSIRSTPTTSCSIVAATVSATTLALAPGKVQVTLTVGGAMSGYWAMGRVVTATPRARTMTIEITAAKIGRSMKNLEMPDTGGPQGVALTGAGLGSTTMPGRTRCTPLTITRSS